MAKKKRPIRIEIPEEMELSDIEIFTLDQAFQSQLVVVAQPGEPQVPDTPLNTTRPPVQIEVVSPDGKVVRKGARRPRKMSGKSRK